MLPHLVRACRDARRAAGLRQIDIATRAGTTHATISRFESSASWPKDPDLWVAAYAHELEVDEIELWEAATGLWRDSTG